jgi:carboxypeptidase family protein
MGIRTTLRTAIAAMLALAIAAPALAQVTGTVLGSVKDAQGAVVPGATVTLVSAARGSTMEAQTNAQGDYVFPNVASGTYTVRVTMDGFRTVERPGVVVSPGDRLAVPALTIEVGALSDTVTVKAETPPVQASSGERSFTVATDAVANLPLADRNFATLASLAPGVSGTARIGGGGTTNFMMDGVSTMDTGSNRLLVAVNVESIAEVKVLTSNYQAEYGRSSGLQITAVTKGGTNRFRGTVYDVERNSDWNSNSKVNKLNGDPKTVSQAKDWGFSIGGPVGRPGGINKLFFFYAQEFQPRTGGNNVQRYRLPTALERAGDFSQTTDQNGLPYPYIKDPLLTGACTAADQTACFRDGGIVGKIPADRLYDTGLNILKMFPLPNINVPGVGYNYEITRPTEKLLAYQPAIRLDYQPTQKLRATIKYTAWRQRKQTVNGTIPGFNDTRMQRPVVSTMAMTANYNLNSTTFLEGTYGRSGNDQAGCALTGGGANFCQAALPMNESSNRNNIGLGGLPLLFPDANRLDPSYYATRALDMMDPAPPFWVNGDMLKPPAFSWGNRIANAPPNIPFPGFLNINRTQDVSISLTKVAGRHTLKTGYYNSHSYKAEQATDTNSFGAINFQQDAVGTNPFDTSYGFANAAIGTFSSYLQAAKYVEGNYVYDNREAYVQDNWKATQRLTLDYGVRFVHQQPQYDKLGQAANFLPDRWAQSAAPMLFAPGCSITVTPGTACPTTNVQALNPQTGQLVGPNSVLAIGTIVPGSGSLTNGLFLGGDGIARTTYTFPALGVAPRFGMAYDLTNQQRVVLRGGGGLFYDRPFGNSVISMAGNPPASNLVTVRYGQLQSLGKGGLTTQGAPALNTIQYDPKLPSSWQWNGGIQMTLPWSSSIDVEYVGQHSFNQVQTVNINAVDFGASFLPQNQDPTKVSATPGGAALSTDLMRAYRGYGAIQHRLFDAWRTFHSLQLSFNRRFRDGVAFGLNDTWVLYDHANTTGRIQHNADGSFAYRADQAEADRLLGSAIPNVHILKGHFIWDLPDVHRPQAAARALGLIINDWQVSGIWTAQTGTAYSVGYSYASGGSNVNITGSPDYAGRVKIVGDPGSGCSSNPYQQFNTAAFQGPPIGSVGLDSGASYLRGCFESALDLAIARNIRLGGGRQLQLRVDLFNAPNAAGITGRNTSLGLANPTDPVTANNLPYSPDGTLIESRSRPRGAGVGVANAYQNPRTVQAQIRFSF